LTTRIKIDVVGQIEYGDEEVVLNISIQTRNSWSKSMRTRGSYVEQMDNLDKQQSDKMYAYSLQKHII
jgi:hypothetical protein